MSDDRSIKGDFELEAIAAESIKQYGKKVRLTKRHYRKDQPFEIIVQSRVGPQKYTVHVWTEGDNVETGKVHYKIFDTTPKGRIILS